MAMSLATISKFEELRVMAQRAHARNEMLKGQVAPAPLVQVFEVLEDFNRRMSELEAEQDKKGIMVPDPAQSLVDFVLSDAGFGDHRDTLAQHVVKALMGRVIHEVRKLKFEQFGEVRAAIAKKDGEWKATASGGHDAMVALEERLVALLTGR